MGKNALELRREIERIRDDLDDTLDELGDHVRPRRVYERKTQRARFRIRRMRESVMGSAREATTSTQHGIQSAMGEVGDTASTVADRARQTPDMVAQQTRGNPLAAGLIAFGLGAVLGSLAPPTRAESRAMEAMNDRIEPLKERASESMQEIRADVGAAAQDAVDAVKQDSQAAMSEVKAEARDAAEDVKDQARAGTAGSGAGTYDPRRP